MFILFSNDACEILVPGFLSTVACFKCIGIDKRSNWTTIVDMNTNKIAISVKAITLDNRHSFWSVSSISSWSSTSLSREQDSWSSLQPPICYPKRQSLIYFNSAWQWSQLHHIWRYSLTDLHDYQCNIYRYHKKSARIVLETVAIGSIKIYLQCLILCCFNQYNVHVDENILNTSNSKWKDYSTTYTSECWKHFQCSSLPFAVIVLNYNT